MTTQPIAQTTAEFAAQLAAVTTAIAQAATRVGRDPAEVRLLPVSKTVPAPRLRQAIAAGLTILGENKVQEASQKAVELADTGVQWAVIGHLQTNKAKDVASFATEFHALDSVKVAAALDRRLQALGRSLDVFVQVNTSDEASKFGLAPDQVADFVQQLPQFSALNVRGLMTLAEFSTDRDRVRACFVRLRELRDRLREQAPEGVSLDELSMGMSGDYAMAIEEGATTVRVGQAIFGPRSTTDADYWPR